jgi:hypothetical protein
VPLAATVAPKVQSEEVVSTDLSYCRVLLVGSIAVNQAVARAILGVVGMAAVVAAQRRRHLRLRTQ